MYEAAVAIMGEAVVVRHTPAVQVRATHDCLSDDLIASYCLELLPAVPVRATHDCLSDDLIASDSL